MPLNVIYFKIDQILDGHANFLDLPWQAVANQACSSIPNIDSTLSEYINFVSGSVVGFLNALLGRSCDQLSYLNGPFPIPQVTIHNQSLKDLFCPPASCEYQS
jgi:hypothetical protein